jgi:2Fe-2S ferredoxin
MLEYVQGALANSRLSCQIAVTAALDGLVVRTPEHQ